MYDAGSYHESLAHGIAALAIQRQLRDMPRLAHTLVSLGATNWRLRRF